MLRINTVTNCLVSLHVRHGARTPLTNHSELWKGHVWDVCGQAYKGVPLEVRGIGGGEAPESPHDKRQIATRLEGGCHKGELTLLGQQQALEVGQWLR